MRRFQEYQRLNTRQASVVNVGGFRPTGDPLASHFGLPPVGLVGEIWPVFQGEPLLCVCQLNIAAAPAVPPLLRDIKMITFFVHATARLRNQHNGEAWCLRAYQSFDGLCPLVCPPHVPQVQRGFECRWEECEDQPVYDDSELIVPDGFDPSDIHLHNVHRTKIGGYASNIQSEPWWGYRPHPANPRYCLQVDSEEKVGLIWGDSGTIYIARGTASGYEDQWFLDWQCY